MTTTLILATVLNQTPDLKTILTDGIKEEFLARATYKAVNLTFKDRRPFSMIVNAEQKHTEMFINLFEARKWEVPKDDYAQKKDESNTTFAKRLKIPAGWTDALKLGLKIENEDVKFLSEALQRDDLPQNVRKTFDNLLVASRDHHALAFKRALGIN